MFHLSESILIQSLLRKPVPRTPVWLMRQAGRYLPEYQKTRKQAGDFLTLCKTPELACEVTLQPLRRFKLDAAILFSDILTIPDAMGLGLSFVETKGPCLMHPIRDTRTIDALPVPMAQESLGYVMEAVKWIRRDLPHDIPLIGFSGSPWTLACYMMEGQSVPGFPTIMDFMQKEPDSLHKLLTKLSMMITDYVDEQVRAGVDALMIFDTWGGLLQNESYQRYSLKYMRSIVSQIKAQYPHIPVILFTKGANYEWLSWLSDTECDALSLDWTLSLKEAKRLVGNRVALQGNLDPNILLTDDLTIRNAVAQILKEYGAGNGHIMNLGHGILPTTPWQHVACMVDAVHELSAQYHKGIYDCSEHI